MFTVLDNAKTNLIKDVRNTDNVEAAEQNVRDNSNLYVRLVLSNWFLHMDQHRRFYGGI